MGRGPAMNPTWRPRVRRGGSTTRGEESNGPGTRGGGKQGFYLNLLISPSRSIAFPPSVLLSCFPSLSCQGVPRPHRTPPQCSLILTVPSANVPR